MPKVRIVFSDLDGTLLHYPSDFLSFATVSSEDPSAHTATLTYTASGTTRECVTVGSLTGGLAYMSLRTTHLIVQLRALGVVFVIVTGARSSTYASRRASLPDADYEFCENGGRKIAGGVVDAAWTDKFVAEIGAVEERDAISVEGNDPGERAGTLWECYREFVGDGWAVDARYYSSSFRINVEKSGRSAEEFEAMVAKTRVAERGLVTSFNLGHADVYPKGSGKANAARHVLEVEKIAAEEAVALFDDDNDLELGALVGRSFIPGVTHPNVLKAKEKHGDRWTLSQSRGVLGTEEALEAIIALVKGSAEGEALSAVEKAVV